MDGFDQKQGVILLAATNRPDILDPALLRPGRFDRQIVVDRPDLEGRKAILAVHAKDKPLAPGVDLDVIARRTPGFTGADLANLMNEAALLSARHNLKLIGLPQLEEAIDRVMAGPERRSRVISEREKRVIAYHEGGHALVAHALPNTDPVHKISIIPRGRALGYTLTLPTEDKFLVTPQRAGRRAGDAARRAHGRGADLRRPDHRRPERHRPRHHHRPPDGHRVRHERRARARCASASRRARCSSAATSPARPTTPTRSRRASTPRCARSSTPRTRPPSACSSTTARSSTGWRAELIEHETLEAERVQELFADVHMWEAGDVTGPRRERAAGGRDTRSESQQRGRGDAVRQPAPLRRIRVTDASTTHRPPTARGPRSPSTSTGSSARCARSSRRSARTPTATGCVRTPARIAQDVRGDLRRAPRGPVAAPHRHLRGRPRRDGDGPRHPAALAVRAPPRPVRRARRTSPTSPATTAASPACRSSPGWSTASPSARRCRSG